MSLISLRQLLDHAAENNYGVPAFNVNNLEKIRAIMEGAHELDSPVIVQAYAGARKYAGPKFIKSIMEAAIGIFGNSSIAASIMLLINLGPAYFLAPAEACTITGLSSS